MDQTVWKYELSAEKNLWRIPFREIWEYRDLLLIWIRRDIMAIYSQTVLGPLWFFIQPLLTSIAYVFIFSRIAQFSTAGMKPVLFYLSGIILWSYFADCIVKTSSFLKDTGAVLSKVYFPRLIIPLSIVLSSLVKLTIQLGLLFALTLLLYWRGDTVVFQWSLVWLIPVLILIIALMGLGLGVLVASLTNKYRDLSHLIQFGVQLWMFVTPVFFPVAGIADTQYQSLIWLNPLAGVIESFRCIFSDATVPWSVLAYDGGVAVLLLLIGILVFNRIEKDFVDNL